MTDDDKAQAVLEFLTCERYVLDPDDNYTTVLRECRQRLLAGVRAIWLIDPLNQVIHVARLVNGNIVWLQEP